MTAKSLIRDFNNGETNKMLLGLTLESNNNSFVGCAPAWVTDRWYNEKYDPKNVELTYFNISGGLFNKKPPIFNIKLNAEITDKKVK